MGLSQRKGPSWAWRSGWTDGQTGQRDKRRAENLEASTRERNKAHKYKDDNDRDRVAGSWPLVALEHRCGCKTR